MAALRETSDRSARFSVEAVGSLAHAEGGAGACHRIGSRFVSGVPVNGKRTPHSHAASQHCQPSTPFID